MKQLVLLIVGWRCLLVVSVIMTGMTGLVGESSTRAADRISIVGSSTLFPFASAVAEEFGRFSGYDSPIVESTGTGGGFKLFCSSSDLDSPSIVNASRRVKIREYEKCRAAGVSMLEVSVGFDGIVIGRSHEGVQFNVSRRDLFLALAEMIPNQNGDMIPNPNETWRDVNHKLPDIGIRVYGPPPTSGTRDAFVELAMEGGAATFDLLAKLKVSDKKQFKSISHAMREDGRFIEAGENDNLIVQKLKHSKGAIGILGYSFLQQNLGSLRGVSVDGVKPEFDNILQGKYGLARLLYFYVKREHLRRVGGLADFIDAFMDEEASGEEGYLADLGLIPLSEDTRDSVFDAISTNAAYRPE